MREFIRVTNWMMLVMLLVCFSYQGYYLLLIFKNRLTGSRVAGELKKKATPLHRFAILIAARNEEAVIGKLLESIRLQNYPGELINVFVVADNCTDCTAAIAREHGAKVYERFHRTKVGKGYALEYLLEKMKEEKLNHDYDGYFVFDADNLLDLQYVQEMNQCFCQGYEIITSCRNTKNFGGNWITAGYGLWFLHEAQWLNKGRMLNGSSCMVSGTGFFFSQKIAEKMNGWHHTLLTEDIEFSVNQILDGEKIGYCEQAVFYDEQPEVFSASIHQRLRWVKGYQQVFAKYGLRMAKQIFRKKNFSCFDLTMSCWPAFFLSFLSIGVSIATLMIAAGTGQDMDIAMHEIGRKILLTYAGAFFLGAYTMATEWNKIHASWGVKLRAVFVFPVFLWTFAPIAVVALLSQVEWKPIHHGCTVGLSDVKLMHAKQ